MVKRDINEEDAKALETMVDRCSLAGVVGALAEIADEKADHLSSNWQDIGTSGEWHEAAKVLRRAAGAVEKHGV